MLFIVAVFRAAFEKQRWRVISSAPLEPDLQHVEAFIQDDRNPRRCRILDQEGNARDASVEECRGLERAAVWVPEHVEERLQDHFLGRTNRIVEHLRLREP